MILLQILSVLFAIGQAWTQKKALLRMIRNGASKHEARRFHAISGLVRVVFCIVVSILLAQVKRDFFFGLALSGLITWLVFDIALNIFVFNKPFYLGTTAWLDRTIKYGGVKAATLILIIITLNILYV